MEASVATLEAVRPDTGRPTIMRALLLREWWAHRTLLGWLGTVYALAPLVTVIGYTVFAYDRDHAWGSDGLAQHQAWQLLPWHWTFWMGIGLALVLGMKLGGAETSAGLEEGSLSLPPTRSERFRARMGFAFAILGAHIVLNTIAMLVYTNVLPRPELGIGPHGLGIWLLLSCAAPLAIFACAWVAAVNGGPRRRVLLWLLSGTLAFLSYALHGILAELLASPLGSRWIIAGVLLLWACWMLFLSYRIYLTREVHALQDD